MYRPRPSSIPAGACPVSLWEGSGCAGLPRGGAGGGHASPALASPGPFPGEPCVEA